jgi:sugar O-acyltransferase (sialic acid O-acetyltransferase NeuD family)
MKRPIVLIAASGLAREVAAAVEAAGTHEVVGVLDDNSELLGTECAGVPVIGSVEAASDLLDVQFLICAGSGTARRRIAGRLQASRIGSPRYATVVHPTATVPSTCLIGAGTVLLAHVTLTADVTVGEHVVVMPQVVLTHDALVSDCVTLCAGVVIGGNVLIESGAYLGMNSSVRQGVRVGQDSTLGMGAVLLQDLPTGELWAGVPAAALASQPAIRVNRSQGFGLIQEPTERLELR